MKSNENDKSKSNLGGRTADSWRAGCGCATRRMEVMNLVFLRPFRLGGVPVERSDQERFSGCERAAPKRSGEV